MLIVISTTKYENAVFRITQLKTTFVVSTSALLNTRLSNHDRPFDRLPSTSSLRQAQGERFRSYLKAMSN